ncbi:MAG: ABC transporter permease [Holophaga sp.]|jgi:histidine transport system permease protein
MTFSLEGYSHLIVEGTWVTLKVSFLSLVVSFLIGLAGAVTKLSSNRILAWAVSLYTTLIRGIPALVLMLILYFSVQIGLNHLTEKFGLNQIDIEPVSAAIMVLGFIYGAYFTETFRGAYLAVPRGQMEAALSIGMPWSRAFRRIQFPQMMRHALPGVTNNWLVLVKTAGLVSLLGVNDMVKAARQAGNATLRQFFFYGVVAVIFLAITSLSQVLLQYLERRFAIGVQEARL